MDDAGSKPDWQLKWEAEQRAILAGADFPVFAPEGLRVELGGWGGGEGEPVESVSLRHDVDDGPSIDVDSELDRDEHDFAYEAVELLEGHARADVVSASRSLRVDGVNRRFAFASAGEVWVAMGRVGDVTITVQARGIDVSEVRLRALADPTQVIDGTPEYRPHRPGLDVLDPRRVAELADSTPLKALGPKLAAVAQSGIALLAAGRAGSSWIGGEPSLPADTRWPDGTHGAMTFVAQLGLVDLPASVWTGPGSGHLHVFCDVDPDSGNIEGPGGCTILHSPAGAELGVRRFPSELHEDNRLPKQMVKPSVGLTLPDPWATLMHTLGLDGVDFEKLWALKARVNAEQGWHNVAGRLLGWPTWQNDDYMEYIASLRGGQHEEWTLLLQTDALDAELYVALPTADLAAGSFERAEALVEHD